MDSVEKRTLEEFGPTDNDMPSPLLVFRLPVKQMEKECQISRRPEHWAQRLLP